MNDIIRKTEVLPRQVAWWRVNLARIGKVIALYAITVVAFVALMWLFFSHGGPLGRALRHLGISEATTLDAMNVTGLAVLFLLTMIVRRVRFGRACRELGIVPFATRGVVVGLAAIVISVMVLYAVGYRARVQNIGVLWATDIFGPFIEEVLFRGFLFLQFRRWVGLPFWLAAVLASVPFALEHTYEGSSTIVLIEVMTVTFAGGLVFCWLVERWESLWVAWVLHAGLNFTFDIFPFGTTAANNLPGNLHRLFVVVLLVVATAALTKSHKGAHPKNSQATCLL